MYAVRGLALRSPSSEISIHAELSGIVSGVLGLDDRLHEVPFSAPQRDGQYRLDCIPTIRKLAYPTLRVAEGGGDSDILPRGALPSRWAESDVRLEVTIMFSSRNSHTPVHRPS
jgi:hypothetical protein